MSAGSRNMLLGHGATLPSASGSDQIVIGASTNTTYIAGALSLNGALNLSGGTGPPDSTSAAQAPALPGAMAPG